MFCRPFGRFFQESKNSPLGGGGPAGRGGLPIKIHNKKFFICHAPCLADAIHPSQGGNFASFPENSSLSDRGELILYKFLDKNNYCDILCLIN